MSPTRPLREVLTHGARRMVQTPGAFRNWPSVLGDMALGRLGRGPATLHFATRAGPAIDCPNQPGARVPVYEIFAEDCYRLGWFLGGLLWQPIHVVDIGAQVGTFACWLAHLHPQATVTAFEPSPTTAEFLRANVAQNGLVHRVAVDERAVAGSRGAAAFEDNGGASGTNGLVATGHRLATAVIEVQTVTFDDVVAGAPAPVDVVKMDCEGGEYALVYASSPASWRSVRRLVLEHHQVAGESWVELRRWFADIGLHVQHEEPGDGVGAAWLSRDPIGPPPD